jgi:hypothetical protein
MNRNPNIHDFTQNNVERSTIQGLQDETMLDLRSLGFDYNFQICNFSSKKAGNYITIVEAQIQGSITTAEYKPLSEYTRSVV